MKTNFKNALRYFVAAMAFAAVASCSDDNTTNYYTASSSGVTLESMAAASNVHYTLDNGVAVPNFDITNTMYEALFSNGSLKSTQAEPELTLEYRVYPSNADLSDVEWSLYASEYESRSADSEEATVSLVGDVENGIATLTVENAASLEYAPAGTTSDTPITNATVYYLTATLKSGEVITADYVVFTRNGLEEKSLYPVLMLDGEQYKTSIGEILVENGADVDLSNLSIAHKQGDTYTDLSEYNIEYSIEISSMTHEAYTGLAYDEASKKISVVDSESMGAVQISIEVKDARDYTVECYMLAYYYFPETTNIGSFTLGSNTDGVTYTSGATEGYLYEGIDTFEVEISDETLKAALANVTNDNRPIYFVYNADGEILDEVSVTVAADGAITLNVADYKVENGETINVKLYDYESYTGRALDFDITFELLPAPSVSLCEDFTVSAPFATTGTEEYKMGVPMSKIIESLSIDNDETYTITVGDGASVYESDANNASTVSSMEDLDSETDYSEWYVVLDDAIVGKKTVINVSVTIEDANGVTVGSPKSGMSYVDETTITFENPIQIVELPVSNLFNYEIENAEGSTCDLSDGVTITVAGNDIADYIDATTYTSVYGASNAFVSFAVESDFEMDYENDAVDLKVSSGGTTVTSTTVTMTVDAGFAKREVALYVDVIAASGE